jgi:hypothetical protein
VASTLEELGSKLAELDDMRRHAERELSAPQDHQERVEQLEEDRDVLLEEMPRRCRLGWIHHHYLALLEHGHRTSSR